MRLATRRTGRHRLLSAGLCLLAVAAGRAQPGRVSESMVTTSSYGLYFRPHSGADVTLDNNGIDLSTDAGAAVLAVFGGTVSSIFDIPGGGSTVIVSHGGYRTVYSNLATTSVAKGAKIEAGATLGKARTEGGK